MSSLPPHSESARFIQNINTRTRFAQRKREKLATIFDEYVRLVNQNNRNTLTFIRKNIRSLMEYGSQPVICHAAKNGNINAIRFIISGGYHDGVLDDAILYAVQYQHWSIVEFLIRKNYRDIGLMKDSDFSLNQSTISTIISCAIHWNRTSLIELLIDNNYEFDQSQFHALRFINPILADKYASNYNP
jgi:hypothetical protein